MAILCATKQAILKARYQNNRLACRVGGGHPIHRELLPNGEFVEVVALGEVNDLLCVRDALRYKQKENADMQIGELIDHLQACNWDLEPWNSSQPEKEKVPHLYIYVASAESSMEFPMAA